MLTNEMMFLSRYVWYGDKRPLNKDDIYRRPQQQVVTETEADKRATRHQFNL